MERLTERHYKKSTGYYMKCSEYCEREESECFECEMAAGIVNRLGYIEDILGDEYDLERLRELVEADRKGRCSISPKLVCMDEVTTPTLEQYRWMMGRFLKGEQDG